MAVGCVRWNMAHRTDLFDTLGQSEPIFLFGFDFSFEDDFVFVSAQVSLTGSNRLNVEARSCVVTARMHLRLQKEEG